MLVCAGYWCKRPAAADDGTLVKLTPLCDWILAIYCSMCNWLYCEFEIEFFPAAEENQGVHGSNEVVVPELSRQQSRTNGTTNGRKDSSSLSEHTNTSGISSQASGSSASTVQSGADCGSRSYPKGVPPREQAGYHEVLPGAEGVARRTGPEVKHPVQESGLQCSSDLVLTVPVIPRRAGLVLGHNTLYVIVYVLCVLICSCACVYTCI